MKVRLDIQENEVSWSGEMVRENSKAGALLCYRQAKPGAFLEGKGKRFQCKMLLATESLLPVSEVIDGQTNHRERIGDPHGVKDAHMQASKNQYRLTYKVAGTVTESRSLDEFQRLFLRLCQAYALDHAGRTGQVIATTNFVDDFWTAEHVVTLARRLGNRRSKEQVLRLKEYLLMFWESRELCRMDAVELAKHINEKLKANFKKDKVWQTARRSGLFSDRKQGPKARGER